MADTDTATLGADLALRFGEEIAVPEGLDPHALATLARIAGRSSNRRYQARPVDPALVYFRCVPAFETSSDALGWIDERLFVGTGVRRPDRVEIDCFVLR